MKLHCHACKTAVGEGYYSPHQTNTLHEGPKEEFLSNLMVNNSWTFSEKLI